MIKLKFKSFSLYLILFVFVFSISLRARQLLNSQDKITSEKKRLLILASKESEEDLFPIENEIASIVANVATKLGRFEVIDRNNLESILQEQAIRLSGVINDSTVVNVGQIASANEALIIDIQNFSQRGVPPDVDDQEDDENDKDFWAQVASSIVQGIFSGGDEQDFEHNIETQLSVTLREVNIESGQSLDALDVDVIHTGGTRSHSRSEAIAKFKKKLIQELKAFYLLNSQVVSVDDKEVLLFLGSQLGVSKGTVFEIVEPERIKRIQDTDFVIPGRTAGYVSVSDIATETNRSVILRQWRSMVIMTSDLALGVQEI